MPPPSQSDAWLASRRFGIVIDAGSSGSRLQIYSWKDAEVERLERIDQGRPADVLPRVEKGTKRGEDWVTKVEPGISSFAIEPSLVGPYLAPLLEHAQKQIPPSLHSSTPIYLLATAGMRLLAPAQQADLLGAACTFLRFHSNFRVSDPSPEGPCGDNVRIISGEEEGLFGWVAVNYLMDGFSSRDGVRATYGFLDMGGASTQIAFEPNRQEREHPVVPLTDIRFRLLDGSELHHEVFVTTWLGYGTNQARERYVGSLVSEFDAHAHNSPGAAELVPDPCLPRDLTLSEAPLLSSSFPAHSRTPHTLVGTGSFPECLGLVEPLLNKSAPCPDTPCAFNGVPMPTIDFSVSRFIGVSEYWYSSEQVFGLGGAYNFVQYERAATEFCGKEWKTIAEEHFATKSAVTGTVTGSAQPSPFAHTADVDLARLEMQCFKAAWLVNVLHEGIGLPRIVDAGGNSSSSPSAASIADTADRKGLGAPAFQSMDTVGDTAITWTLGKMVLEAASEVQPVQQSEPPSLFDLDRLRDTLHPSLARPVIGSVPLFYVLLLFILAFIVYQLRNRIRPLYRKITRSRPQQNGFEFSQAFALEAGERLPSNGHAEYLYPMSEPIPLNPLKSNPKSVPSLVRHSLRRVRSFLPRPSPYSTTPIPSPPQRALSSASIPLSQQARLNPYGQLNGHSGVTLRGPSPANSIAGETSTPPSPTRATGLSPNLPTLSRNSSQVNLTTLMPRTGSYIRGGGPR